MRALTVTTWRTIGAAALVLGALGWAGCEGASPEGVACSENSNCPTGYICDTVAGHCAAPDTLTTPRREAIAHVDASLADIEEALPDAPSDSNGTGVDAAQADQASLPDMLSHGDHPLTRPDGARGDILRSDSLRADILPHSDMIIRTMEGGVACPPLTPNTFYVRSTYTGTQNGSSSCPFRTISQAVTAANAGGTPTTQQMILVTDGSYSSNLGETFPLSIGQNIAVQGSYGTKCDRGVTVTGAGMVLVGSNPVAATLVLSGNGEIDCMTVAGAPGGAIAVDLVVATGTDNHLSHLLLTGGANDVLVYGLDSTKVSIDASDITMATTDGVHIDGTGAPTVSITGSNVDHNASDGVNVIKAQSVTIGPGAVPSGTPCPVVANAASCSLYCNGRYGTEAPPTGGTTSAVVVGEVNAWDHDPATSSLTPPQDVSSILAVDTKCPLNPAAGACP
jgi:hypothetical protein